MYEYLRQKIAMLECQIRTLLENVSTGTSPNPLEVQDDGTIVETTTNRINFTGLGVTVTSEGPNSVEVSIPGNVSGGSSDLSFVASPTNLTINNTAGDGVIIPPASKGLAGGMSASDKTRLDGMEDNSTADQTGAEIVSAINLELGQIIWQQGGGSSNLSKTVGSSTININNTSGSGVSLEGATPTQAGLMTSTDKVAVQANSAKLSANTTNVNLAGAVMNTDVSTTEMSFVIDEDSFLSNSDTKIPTQQSVKAYVDARIINQAYPKTDFNLMVNGLNVKGEYFGVNAPVLVSISNGYEIRNARNIDWLNIIGNSSTLNGSQELSILMEGVNRKRPWDVHRNSTNIDVDESASQLGIKQMVLGQNTSFVIGGLAAYGSSGFTVIL